MQISTEYIGTSTIINISIESIHDIIIEETIDKVCVLYNYVAFCIDMIFIYLFYF